MKMKREPLRFSIVIITVVLGSCSMTEKPSPGHEKPFMQIQNNNGPQKPEERKEPDQKEEEIPSPPAAVVPDTVDEHLAEPRVKDFFNGTTWRRQAGGYGDVRKLSSDYAGKSFSSSQNISYGTMAIQVQKAGADQKSGGIWWQVVERNASFIYYTEVLYYFPDATASGMGNRFFWGAKRDSEGHIVKDSGKVFNKES